ncbi:hypothetical protein MB901379_04141 [Mycobacterium basiliense]|uniref:Uncharacterized protein n=1 Tax=Mycobacterium basiliense TaxID=2094119 RepID=A0A3S4BZ86_9MYCO|nr:hypothetical protein MB901379_04141 [Mycobacterium basiliense]
MRIGLNERSGPFRPTTKELPLALQSSVLE